LQAVILGLVEGITEFLPISSTGHMILAAKWLGVFQSDFVKSFEIVIQLGAMAAIAILYWRRLAVEKEISKRILIAFVPTGMVGFVLYKLVKTYLIGNVGVTVGALFVGGIAMIVLEKLFEKGPLTADKQQLTLADLPYFRCVVIGLVQSLAVIPGVSRSAATILAGMGVGLSRIEATEFSFLVATPTLLAASGWDLVKSGISFNNQQWLILGIGFVVAFVSAGVAVKWMMRYLKNHSLAIFGVYRIVLAGVVWFSSRG
jgi:undecaprenyl-diphosphatase